LSASGDPGEAGLRRALDLLVPEGGELLGRAADTADLVRELVDTASVSSPVTAGEVSAASRRQVLVCACAAMEDLVLHNLRAVHAGSSFLNLPSARRPVQANWDQLSGLRPGMSGLPGVPFPAEEPLAVAARLLQGLDRLGWDRDLVELYQARLRHLDPRGESGETSFREALSQRRSCGVGSRTYAELLMGLIECLLDRGAVREAHELSREDLRVPSRSAEVRWLRLRHWTAMLMGQCTRVPKLDSMAATLEIPHSLVELREHWEAERASFPGRAVQGASAQRALTEQFPLHEHGEAVGRSSIGAAVFCVFLLEVGGVVTPLHVDTAPGLRDGVAGWLREREEQCSVRTGPEHRMVVQAASQRVHGRCESSLGTGSLALALTPILDPEGEVAGWLHIEWEHHLIPTGSRLARLAEVWRSRLWRLALEARGPNALPVSAVSETDPVDWRVGGGRERLLQVQSEPSRELCSQLFRRCLVALGIKLRQRRWWAFVQEGDALRYVCSGGDGLGSAESQPGAARAIDRCLATSGPVVFEEHDPGLALFEGSASGVVLPLSRGGRIVGLLAIESSRQRDFRPSEVERLMGIVTELALPLSLAAFRAWHLERFGNDLFLDCTRAPIRELASWVDDAVRAKTSVVLSGPNGSGKRTLARWLHWRRGAGSEPLTLLHCGLDFEGMSARSDFIERLVRPRGSVVLDDLPSLAPELQIEFLRLIEEGGGGPSNARDWRSRLLLTTPLPLGQSVRDGTIHPELAARLERMQIFVPGMSDRRQEISGLVSFLAQRFAAEEGMRAPLFDDDAVALLWRQPWRANLRELESLVFQLVLLHPSQRVSADLVIEVARRFKFALIKKLPSLRPRRQDLVQALRTTLKSTGSLNKRRAALYLGWDPDTLVSRLEDYGLDAAVLEAEAESWGL
jgi:hypothetical protein